MKLTLRQLEIFAAIARCENVSHAAAQLALSQSAASSALVELERAYNCPLFDRIGKSLHLNATGRGLLARADALLAQALDIEAYLAGKTLGPLHIGATLTIGNYLATLLLADYMRLHPESPVKLHVANTDAIAERLLRFECDLGLIEGDLSHPDLDIRPWLADELVICCAPGHRLAAAGRADNAQLADEAWILREAGSGTRQQFDHIVGTRLQRVDIKLELEHTEAIKRAVESGLGITCLSRLSLREALRRGSLVEIVTPQFDLRRQFHLVTHRRRHASAAVQTFIEQCDRLTVGTADTGGLTLPFIP